MISSDHPCLSLCFSARLVVVVVLVQWRPGVPLADGNHGSCLVRGRIPPTLTPVLHVRGGGVWNTPNKEPQS